MYYCYNKANLSDESNKMTIVVEVSKNLPEVTGIKKTDSKYSAEKLRVDILEPSLRDLRPNERFVIIIDDKKDKDAYQYSSAYLIEAFIGLITYGFMSYARFIHTVAFDCHHKENEFYIDKIFEYSKKMQEERENKKD